MSSALIADITAPSVNYYMLAPILIVLGGAVLSVLVEAFYPRESRRSAQIALVLTTLVVAFLAVLNIKVDAILGFTIVNSLAIDGVSVFLQGLIILSALVGALLISENRIDPLGDAFAAQSSALPGSEDELAFTERGWYQTEIWSLFLFSVGGMLIFPIANDLLTLFVALEVMSLPLYLLVGMARRRRLLSQEAALKYFVLGAFSSAFMLYGSALVYGFANSVELGDIAKALSASAANSNLMLVGGIFILIGLLFKVGAAPFHQWTPDVYQGAPTAITAFMSAGTKVAAFGALLRVFYVALSGLAWDLSAVLWAIAIITMLVGTIIGVAQSDIKRMLAYSSIAHAGFLLLGVIAQSKAALDGSLFYLAGYAFTSLGAFAVVSLVRDASGEANHLGQWAGLGKRSPVIASVFTLFLLALAGIPLTSGFVGKFAVFAAAYEKGLAPLVVVAVIASAIAGFFYVRVIVLMFFTDASGDEVSVVVPSFATAAAITITAVVTIVLGVIPQPVFDLLSNALFLK
ncbi:MAG: NADH-quinone oxidoreductase subunit NuoN [Actinobacteria bacterium]|nr:NADH-quinone oxidoreductase subunit NuoN [Actinomycetota bacterium]